jgi:hypothetical protein
MKTHSIVALALGLTVAGPIAHARAGTDPLLRPSIVPFSTGASSMVSTEDVPYYGFLKTPPIYYGSAAYLQTFFKAMDRDGYDIQKKQDALKKETDFYIESVEELGKVVIPRLKTTTQTQLDGLAQGGVALEKILQYSDTHAHVQAALLAEDKANKRLHKAMTEIEADSLLILKIDLTAEREDLDKQKKEILDRAKAAAQKAGLAGKLMGLATSGTLFNPAKLEAELTKEAFTFVTGWVQDQVAEALMNNVLLENAETLNAIDARLGQIAKVMPGRTDVEKKRLAAKRDELEAARIDLMEAGIRRKLATVEAVDKIDILTAMERGAKARGSKLEVFQGVQDYFEEMRMSERRIRVAANDYLAALDLGAPGQTPLIVSGIDRDVAWVKTRRDAQDGDAETLRWLKLANFTGVYMSKQERWYRNERERVQGILASLDSGKHLDFVESTMASLQLRAGSKR